MPGQAITRFYVYGLLFSDATQNLQILVVRGLNIFISERSSDSTEGHNKLHFLPGVDPGISKGGGGREGANTFFRKVAAPWAPPHNQAPCLCKNKKGYHVLNLPLPPSWSLRVDSSVTFIILICAKKILRGVTEKMEKPIHLWLIDMKGGWAVSGRGAEALWLHPWLTCNDSTEGHNKLYFFRVIFESWFFFSFIILICGKKTLQGVTNKLEKTLHLWLKKKIKNKKQWGQIFCQIKLESCPLGSKFENTS